MPDRDIGTPRQPIARSDSTIGSSLPSYGGTVRSGDLTRGITSVPAALPPSSDILGTIQNRIAGASYFDRFGYQPFSTAANTASTAGSVVGNVPLNTFQTLADALSKSFGNAVYNPPLQNQAYGYTPVSSGGNLTMYLLLGGLAIGGYYLYKRYSG